MAVKCGSKSVKRGVWSLISLVLLLAAANISQAAALVNWNNGTGNQHWGVGGNWQGGVVPYVDWDNTDIANRWQDDAQIILAGGNGVIFDATDANEGLPRYVFFIPIGVGAGVSGEMWMNGGTLYAPYGLTFNKGGLANNTANSTLHMTGGLLHLRAFPGYVGAIQSHLAVPRTGTGTVNMTGGTIKCLQLQIPYTTAPAGTNGTVNLNGGVIEVGQAPPTESLSIATVQTGVLNITAGRLILKGDKRTVVNGYVTNSKIVPYPGVSGRKIVHVDYNTLSDSNTTVTASLTALEQAYNPMPIDTSAKVMPSDTLSWTAGNGATSHDVYLGTVFADVNEGLVTPVTRNVNNYDPPDFTPGLTYYWRVDENDGSTTHTGLVWSFTVANGALAINPDPDNGAAGVNVNADLSWTPGIGIVSHDVYFGISFNDVNEAASYNVLPGRGRQAAASYDPGTLVAGQTYYWRIDEFDGSVVNRGQVWSFTTAPAAAAQTVTPPYLGDLIGHSDGTVTWEDMAVIAEAWLGGPDGADLNGDSNVTFKDYSLLAQDWLKTPAEYDGKVYYVAAGGSDSNPGTQALPWATIQKAAGVITAGDTVVVGAGTYSGQVTMYTSGSSQGCGLGDLPITFLADPAGDVILNAGDSANNNGFYIVGGSYIVIDGFQITGGRDGIFFDGDSDTYHVIRNCKIYGNSRDGIRIHQAEKVTVEGSLLYGNAGAGIKTADDVEELQVVKCGIYGNGKGLELDGSSAVADCIITNNTTYGVRGDANQIVTYSDVWNNTTDYSGGASAGTNCISGDPLLVNPPTDFHLSGGSPCIAAASDGGNMGYKYPPIANAGMDRTVYANEAVTFNGSASRGSITSYDWSFGDSSTGSGQVVTHTYASAGTYTAELEVDSTDTATCTVEVLPARVQELVYHVVNLTSSGAGSFADCLTRANSDGVPRRIVFNVGGTIHSPAVRTLSANNTTICGTEAPAPGITFDFDAATSGFSINGANCRMCNITVTNTKLLANGHDGFVLNGQNNILERCTATYCTDEGVSVMDGYGHVVAFCLIENCGSITDEGNGRGLSVWYGSGAIVAGNYIGDNLRGALCGDYESDNFMDFRNNLVTLNNQTFGLKASSAAKINIIDNTIINNSGSGIKYADGAEFYRSGNILSGNSTGNETYDGAYTEASSPFTRSDTPYPNWLENIITPTSKTQTGMGSGKCQCVLYR